MRGPWTHRRLARRCPAPAGKREERRPGRMSPQGRRWTARRGMATSAAMRGGGRNRVTAVAVPEQRRRMTMADPCMRETALSSSGSVGGGLDLRGVEAAAASADHHLLRPASPPSPPLTTREALLSLSQSLSLSLFLSFWLVSSRTARWRIGRRQRRGGVEAAPVERRHRRLVGGAGEETWGP